MAARKHHFMNPESTEGTLLIVDDEPRGREALEGLLLNQGYRLEFDARYLVVGRVSVVHGKVQLMVCSNSASLIGWDIPAIFRPPIAHPMPISPA